MTADRPPWQATVASTVLSQGGLFYAQHVLAASSAPPAYQLGVAVLQCVQGAVAANGLGVWRAASAGVARVVGAVRGAKPPEGGA